MTQTATEPRTLIAGDSPRIPPYIYPDPEDRTRIIKFTITGYTQRQVHRIDLSIQVRHCGRWFLGAIERNDEGWYVANVDRVPVYGGETHETPEAAAIAAHELYREAKRAARLADLKE